MRSDLSCMVVFYMIQYFKCKKILELGFYQGQTFGVMLEATDRGSHLSTVDINFINDLYYKYYKDSQYTDGKSVEFFNISSLDFQTNTKFDFINIDTGDDRKQDFINSLDWISENGIIMFDNYDTPYFHYISNELINLDTPFYPFLIDGQAMYFVRVGSDTSNFEKMLADKLREIAVLDRIKFRNEVFLASLTPIKLSTFNDTDSFLLPPEVMQPLLKHLKI